MGKEVPSIPEYFAGKSIFITGGTGFMGKVLIEKLLRSCPDIKAIYILIRSKKGKNPLERIKIMTDMPLFKVIREKDPKLLNKILPIEGDVTELGLGLSDSDRQLLINEVSIIYHAAASVRFDDPLKDAILMNTRSTREVVYLARKIKHLDVLIHVSTTYCNTNRKVIGEQVYPPHADWQDAIKMAENIDSTDIDLLAPKYINPLPNTYTFTKSLSEHVINDLCDGSLPAVILRPSIVISTLNEPFPGWIDNFNGPVGLLSAVGKGVLRSIYTDPNIVADYLPVDIITKAIIACTWSKAIKKDSLEKNKVEVYNLSNNDHQPISMKDIMVIGKKFIFKFPLSTVLWIPDVTLTTCWYAHYLKVLIYHLLPALFVDAIFKLSGHKPMLFKVQRKIYIANMALEYFLRNEWKFENTKILELEKTILPEDMPDFGYVTKTPIDTTEYLKNALLGGREFLMKEPPSTIEMAKARQIKMYYLSLVVKGLWYAFLFYFLVYYIDILKIFKNVLICICNYFRALPDF